MVHSSSDSFLEEPEFNSDDLFKILESLEDVTQSSPEKGEEAAAINLVSQKSSAAKNDSSSFPSKKRKRNNYSAENSLADDGKKDGHEIKNASHITVERNRRKQMNEHLAVLRSLMPCFYVKRGDQASIIGGVVDYINELQQVLQSLEAKKRRKVYSEVLSPRVVISSPRLLAPSSPLISPKKPPLSPKLNLPISPRTPQPTSPYKPRFHQQSGYLSPTTTLASTNVITSSFDCSSNLSTSFSNDVVNSISVNTMGTNELIASSKSSVADVEVKFCGANVLLNTVSQRIPGQAAKIISVLEGLSLEILQVSINTIDETMINSFTIKIGIECQLSAEELAHEVQQTFCQVS